MKLLMAFSIVLLSGSSGAQDEKTIEINSDNMGEMIAIAIQMGDNEFTASLHDNPTSQSFVDQMPLTVELEDYAGIEKIFYPEPALSTLGAPAGANPSIGDIMYYAPWRDVVIFYKDFGYASGLIPMGGIDNVEGLIRLLKDNNEVIFKLKEVD